VGSIGTVSSNLAIGTSDTGLYFNAAAERILPMNMSTFALRDGGIDLGATNAHFKDLYLSSGVNIKGSTPKITLEHSNENGTAQIYTTAQSGIILDADPDNTDSGTPIQLKTDGKARLLVEDSGNISFYEDTGTTAKMTWLSSSEILNLTDGAEVRVRETDSSNDAVRIASDVNEGFVQLYHDGVQTAQIRGAGGNYILNTLSVGITSNPVSQSGTTAGGQYFLNNSYAAFARVGGVTAYFNRQYSNGEIVQFRQDGSPVANIGVANTSLGTNPYIAGSGGRGLSFDVDTNTIFPCTSTGARADNTADLGVSTARFNDAYITNGVTTGSDFNDKQNIETLSDAEVRVATACKGLLRKWKWKSAVAEKGDNARTHFGIIAQDLQDAFTAEGLDAGDYAMFMSNTWWELDGETYETEEEAPEGATENTRLGVRYNQLLAFIISAI
jgi:hypothetical protein